MLSRAIDIFLSQDILNGSYHDIQRMLLLFEFGNRLGCLSDLTTQQEHTITMISFFEQKTKTVFYYLV